MGDLRGETREQLLALAASSGHRVTEHQIVRWHREGLLPRPRQRSLGRGRGTETVYPTGTGEQLLALCAIHAEERRLDHVAWRLWWAGYDIPTERVRGLMEHAVADWDRHVPGLTSPDTGYLSDEAIGLLEEHAEGRLAPPLSGARRRVGKERFSSFLSVMLEALSGGFGGFLPEPTGKPEEEERRIVERGLGLGRAETGRLEGANLLSKIDVDACLRDIGWLTDRGSLREELASLTEEQLSEARDEIRSWLALLAGYGSMFEGLLGRGPFEFISALSRLVKEMGAQEQALWTLVWAVSRFRGPAHLREGLKAHGRPTAEMEEGLRDWERLTRLRGQVPTLAKILTPRRVMEGLRATSQGPQELERFGEELSEVSRRAAKTESKPPRRLAPSGSTACRKEGSACRTSLHRRPSLGRKKSSLC